MHRWLAILLLALLPLQFSWSAVTAYCEHESGPHAQHLGHHEHLQADPDSIGSDGATADPSAPAGFDLDCGHCHGTFVGVPAPVDSLAPLALASCPAASIAGRLRTLAQSPPERPQWRPLA